MNNNQLFPFQRNRYYSGKLLTSADFQAEQDYFNKKSRFVNSLMYGSGVVCGLGVVSLDDVSILIESGVAIDGFGREIIQDSSVVKKLSAIEGFEQLETEEITLCIRYEEEPVHSVFVVGKNQSDEEYEYSRVSEKSVLFLCDKANVDASFDFETEFFTEDVMYSNEDFVITLRMPSVVSKGNAVKLDVIVEKLSDADNTLTFNGVLQHPGFENPDGAQNQSVNFDNVKLEMGEQIVQSYWCMVQKSAADTAVILLQAGNTHVFINDEAMPLSTNFELGVILSDLLPREIVNMEIGRTSLEMRNLDGGCDYVQLADIKLLKTANSYVIESIKEHGIKKYVPAPSHQLIRSAYLEYFVKNASIKESAGGTYTGVGAKNAEPVAAVNAGPQVATGILEIPLGTGARRGDIKYSGEIMHGLGKGNVYIDIGFESISEDASLGANAKTTVFGVAELFRQDKSQAPMVETAIKVLNDKGSFVVAARMLENVEYLVLTYRWVAIKFPTGEDSFRPEDYAGKSIIPETPTVVLETRESHFFGVRFENMESCSIVYELTEEGSGDITSDGVYTAPAKEGVYEIRIYCAEMPVVCAYAYAIVKKKGLNDEAATAAKGSIIDDLPI